MTYEFPTPFIVGEYGEGAEPKTLLERKIAEVSATIRRKPDWQTKVRLQSVVNKWKQECFEQGITEEQYKFIIDELKYYTRLSENKIRISPVDGVYEADNIINPTLRKDLLECVSVLENVPEDQKDWHPDSGSQVLDLVHPSLFCFVNNVTNVTDQTVNLWDAMSYVNVGSKLHMVEKNDYSYSNKYQWLPTEFSIDQNGKARIKSYINNLEPLKHRKLYSVLEDIFSEFVGMFNKVLTSLLNPPLIRINGGIGHEDVGSDEYDSDGNEIYFGKTIIPDVEKFVEPTQTHVYDLKGKQVQVIVKLANIILTPDKPDYTGGVWHVEGMKNEDIVASGIYYYDTVNISESRLSFREVIKEPEYDQNDDEGVEQVYGLNDEDALNQPLGYLLTQTDRCIAFPNMFQHRVEPFSLIDKTKSGHRKIVVFFLVNPEHRILSTANVPPQQLTMSLEDAKKYRTDLMAERKYFVNTNNEELFERPFSLCEH